MYILVLGAAGMLGHKMFQKLRESFPWVEGLVRRRPEGVPLLAGRDVHAGWDLEEIDSLDRWLAQRRPAWVINCAGVIKQREQAHDPAPCLAINALLPHRLARALAQWGGRLIHFSTDCVFKGDRGGYTELDAPDAADLYGRTKALGEVLAPNALVFRTSMIGRELSGHRSLLDWFLAQECGRVRGYRRAIYSGLTTLELARLTEAAVLDYPTLHGLFHAVAEPISKYELLCLLREAFGLRVEIQPDNDFFCDRSLCGARLRNTTGYMAPSWPDLVRELAEDATPYSEWAATLQSA
jgi:dTDP-4-dehydrorhamnose reductase